MQSANLFSNMGRAVIEANFAYLTFALCKKFSVTNIVSDSPSVADSSSYAALTTEGHDGLKVART